MKRAFLILILLLFSAGIYYYYYYPSLLEEEVLEEMEITLYFVIMTETDFALYPVERSIPPSTTKEESYRRALELLIEGPRESEDVEPALPKEAVIREIQVEGDTITVDFSQEIRSLNVGARGEEMTIYSIVNTLTEFPEINQVQLQVEGESRVSLAGHYMLIDAFTRSEEVIYRE